MPRFIYNFAFILAMLISIITYLIAGVLALLSAFVLNIAAKLLGGRSSFFKALAVNFVVFAGTLYIRAHLSIFTGALSFAFLLLVYKYMFDVGWIRALLIWLLQGFLVLLLVVILILHIL